MSPHLQGGKSIDHLFRISVLKNLTLNRHHCQVMESLLLHGPSEPGMEMPYSTEGPFATAPIWSLQPE